MHDMKNANIKIAASAAASWAWGTSLVVGRSTLQTKGLMAFLIWGICNCIALPLFSLVVHKVKPMKGIINSKPLTLFMTVIQIFSVWIQMNAIYEICMQTGFMSATVAQIISYSTAAIFIVAMYKNGLFRSIMSDQVQWGGVIVFSALICIIGWLTHSTNPTAIQMNATVDNLHWGIKSGLILFCGPIMDIQHWQRIDYADQQDAPRAYALAGLMFAGYLFLVALTASLQFNAVMHVMLMLAVYCVATSTLDSAAVAMQKLGGRNLGLALGLIAVATWQLVINVGVLNLWTYMGTVRLYVCVGCLALSAILAIRNRGRA